MNKTFLFLPLAFLLLGACATETTQTSSSNETATSIASVSGPIDNTNYGSKESPLTVSDVKTMVDGFENGEISKKPIFVKGIIGHNWAYSEEESHITAYYSSDDGSEERAMSLFDATFDQGIDFASYKAEKALVGKEVISTGVVSFYVDRVTNNRVIKIAKTLILSVKDPATPRIPTTLEVPKEITILADGIETQTIEYVVKPFGCKPIKATYSVSGNDHVSVDENGNVKCAVGASDADATVTVKVGTLTATVTIKINIPIEGQISQTVSLETMPEGVVDKQLFSITKNHVSFVGDKGSHKTSKPRWWGSSTSCDVRLYKGNLVTITPDANYQIIKIEFIFNSGNDNKATYEISNGSLETTTEKLIATPTDGSQAMVLTRTGEGTSRWKAIKIIVAEI